MATNFADISHDIAARRTQLSFEHRFFMAVAVFFPLITIIGFAPSYYFKTLFNTPPLPSALVHAHGLTMSLWIVLYVVQTFLISAKRIRLHMDLGYAGIAVAAAAMIVGAATAYASAARGSSFPGYTVTEFFIVPLADLIVFPIIFSAAIYLRKRPADHKRLMLVTVLTFLPPSIARLPFPFIVDLGAIWFIGVPCVMAIALLIGDTYRSGKLNRAFAAGVTLLVGSGPLRMAIARTEAWTNFATWILS